MKLIKNFLGINGRENSSYSIAVGDALMRDGVRANGHTRQVGYPALVFARNFFAHPKMLGSIIPSSPFLIRRLLRQIDWQRARVVVEYGPGTGCITGEILKRLPKDGLLIAIDMNREFVQHLRNTLPDPRLRVFEGSAADVLTLLNKVGVARADYVISGIPFSTIPLPIRKSIMTSTAAALEEDGCMLVYQFSTAVLPHLRECFNQIETDFEPLNILPARLFFCRKQRSSA